jgi:hemerythrin-like metal-binding protein
VWDFQLETRFPGIDEDHRALDLLLTSLQSACTTSNKDVIAKALKAYTERTAKHFEYEARLMEAVGDPARPDHWAAHGTYIAELKRHAAELEGSGVTPAFRRYVMVQLGDWFRAHVKSYDQALVRQLDAFLRTGAALPGKS